MTSSFFFNTACPFVNGSPPPGDQYDSCFDVFPRLPHSDRCFDKSRIRSNLGLLGRTVWRAMRSAHLERRRAHLRGSRPRRNGPLFVRRRSLTRPPAFCRRASWLKPVWHSVSKYLERVMEPVVNFTPLLLCCFPLGGGGGAPEQKENDAVYL